MQFAQRVQELKAVAVYDILKHTQGGKAIAFAAGNPAPEAFPHDQIATLSSEIMKKDPITALQYGMSQGYEPLRNTLSFYLSDNLSIGGQNDDVLITSGATQGIELCAKIFCNEGDTIITENPTFIGSLNSFNSYNLNIVGVDMEYDGMDMDKLEAALQAEKNVRFIYVIPNFQNPSGWTMSFEKRKRLYELALKYNTLILEDDPYGALRYFGQDIPSIKSFDTNDIVLYAGSFSKTISPGMRVGYMVAKKPYIDKMTIAKQAADVHTPLLNQMIVYEFMKDDNLNKHIRQICNIYRDKLQLTFDNLDKCLGDKISYIKPEGGLYVFAKLEEHINMHDYCKKSLEAGVAIVWGDAFLVEPNPNYKYFRLNFSTPTDEQLVKGIKILGEVLDKMYV